MNINENVSGVMTTVINANSARKQLASKEVIARQRSRNAITIAVQSVADSACYIGGENVTTTNGLPLAVGDKITISLDRSRSDQIYAVGGTVVIAEWF